MKSFLKSILTSMTFLMISSFAYGDEVISEPAAETYRLTLSSDQSSLTVDVQGHATGTWSRMGIVKFGPAKWMGAPDYADFHDEAGHSVRWDRRKKVFSGSLWSEHTYNFGHWYYIDDLFMDNQYPSVGRANEMQELFDPKSGEIISRTTLNFETNYVKGEYVLTVSGTVKVFAGRDIEGYDTMILLLAAYKILSHSSTRYGFS